MPVSRRAFVIGGAFAATLPLTSCAASAPAGDSAAAHGDKETVGTALKAVAGVAALAGAASQPQATFLAWTAAIHSQQADTLARAIGAEVPVMEATAPPADSSAYGVVATAEQALVQTVRSCCRDASDPDLVRLLASIAASASQQAALLEGLA